MDASVVFIDGRDHGAADAMDADLACDDVDSDPGPWHGLRRAALTEARLAGS